VNAEKDLEDVRGAEEIQKEIVKGRKALLLLFITNPHRFKDFKFFVGYFDYRKCDSRLWGSYYQVAGDKLEYFYPYRLSFDFRDILGNKWLVGNSHYEA